MERAFITHEELMINAVEKPLSTGYVKEESTESEAFKTDLEDD